MASSANKRNRDQKMDFSGFLNDLQDWELSMKGKDEKEKAQSHEEKKVKIGVLGKAEPRKKATSVGSFRSNDRKLTKGSEALNRISNALLTEESSPDAASEKELGNEYFKQKKYNDSIDCYSRSIALSPTAVAFANRAMAYEEAENDCTEALDLDDRYIKAYSRRATARRELGKLKASLEDSEFALRLEPHNEELKKQHAEAKALYDKEMLDEVSGAMKNAAQGAQKGASTPKAGHIEVPGRPFIIEEIENRTERAISRSTVQESDGVLISSTNSLKTGNVGSKQDMKASLEEVVSRASSHARAEAAKNIAPPKSAYQFEVSWRGLSGDPALQARFLKAVPPVNLPKLFGNALSTPVLIDIVKCVATFFMDDTELSIGYLENLTKVSRFEMIIMCASAADRADLHNIWEGVFSHEAVPIEYVETINKLCSKYFPRGV
ncbi:hypothetical protein GIB67_022909 [Kingdonia uniflora]|uniref:RNA-polymerase II-associated protein 3-like C-terminal domain-containing protein n=1 Tax=Kingdonia uniflora TaxID=39325 RepID=A0A7J7KWC6_9MAGN|nr:hypothetical protein GIB67_022909 [Kingdonia uniflora]